VKYKFFNTSDSEALGAATEETVLQYRCAATNRAHIKGWGWSFNGQVVTNEQVLCEVFVSESGSHGTGVGITKTVADVGALNQPAKAEQPLGQSYETFSAEPTKADNWDRQYIHPQGGYSYRASEDDDHELDAGQAVNLTFTAPDAVNVIAWILVEE
jgi:hypothetical protein